MLLDVIIEIPYNSFVKYEYDEQAKRIRCDRILNTAMQYPGNYGYIPNTKAMDNDALDILMLCDYPIYPGTIVNCRVIGVLLMEDEKGLDEKVLVVPSEKVDPNYVHFQDLEDLPKILTSKIKHFFTHYKDMETEKWVKVQGFKNKEYAIKLYQKYKI